MIVGVLCWYDEQPEMLAASVSGFARVCDQIVACDGAYALYPQAKPRSHPVQASTILHAAEAAGVGCLVHRPSEVFVGNEVEKRNLSLELAARFCTSSRDSVLSRDWILVFDADFQIAECNPELIRRDLDGTEKHVATYNLIDEYGPQPFRGIYRWAESLIYGPKHSDIRGIYGIEQVSLRDVSTPALDLYNLTAYHSERTDEARVSKATAFDQMRNIYAIEEPRVVA